MVFEVSKFLHAFTVERIKEFLLKENLQKVTIVSSLFIRE